MSRPINTAAEFEAELAAGKWVWPGGYPQYFVMEDGEALSFEMATACKTDVTDAFLDDGRSPGCSDQWRIVGVEVNWEDSQLRCCHTDALIESAYGPSDEMFGGSAATTQGVFA